jgi:ketosteroid isomerase-like protein
MPVPATPESEPVEVLIYDRTEEWMRLWNNGQFDKVIDLYARDALYLPAHNEPIFGRNKIREFLHLPMRQGATDFKLETQFIQLAGELVYDVGRYSILVPHADGSFQRDSGRYLVVWQLQGPEDWRILVYAAWSSEKPA